MASRDRGSPRRARGRLCDRHDAALRAGRWGGRGPPGLCTDPWAPDASDMSELVVLATTAVTGAACGVMSAISPRGSQRSADRSASLWTATLMTCAKTRRASTSSCDTGAGVPTGSLLHVHLADTFDRRATALIHRHRRRGPVVITEHLPRTNASDPSLLPGGRTPGAATAKALMKRVQYSAVDQVIAVGGSSAGFLRRSWRLPQTASSPWSATAWMWTVIPGSPARRTACAASSRSAR